MTTLEFYTSTTVFAATKQYDGVNSSASNLTKLSHASFNFCIDQIRTVKVISGKEVFIDIHTSDEFKVTGEAELKINFSGLNWQIVDAIQDVTVQSGFTTSTLVL